MKAGQASGSLAGVRAGVSGKEGEDSRGSLGSGTPSEEVRRDASLSLRSVRFSQGFQLP